MTETTPLQQSATSGFFRALGDPSRLAIVASLAACAGESRTVSQVAACCPLDLSTVSRHLATLKQAGLVDAERRGREVHYRCCCERVAATLRALADAIECGCRPRGDSEATASPSAENTP